MFFFNSTLDVNGVLLHNVATQLSQVSGASVSIQNALRGNPRFANPAVGDYHLDSASAARDTGIPTGTPRDFDGQVRPMGLGYDLGADEHADAALRGRDEFWWELAYLPRVIR